MNHNGIHFDDLKNSGNNLLAQFVGTPFFDDALEFGRIQKSDFLPACRLGYERALSTIETMEKTTEQPTFENTIQALEEGREFFDWTAEIYYNLYSAHGDPELRSLAKDIASLAADLTNRIFLSRPLFSRVKMLWDQRAHLSLNREQSKVLENYYREFIRNGALLPEEQKEELRSIDQKLAVLSPKFSDNLINYVNAYFLEVKNPDDLRGMPALAVEAAKETALQQGKKDCWVFTLHFPSYSAFMKYSPNRLLRKEMWLAYNSRGYKEPHNNEKIVLEIIQLRERRAQLLGYPNHAAFELENRMAKTPEKVFSFLEQLKHHYKKQALKDLEELQQFARELDAIDSLQPWDVLYYSEKLKEKKYAFNEALLRPYFQLERVLQGAFEHVGRLYHIVFIPRPDLPTYHPDVQAYEVRSTDKTEYYGLLYLDFYPRETKQAGAWANELRSPGLLRGKVRRPHATIVCNFTKPTAQSPSLLTFDEVHTLFHELGHALHLLLTEISQRSIAGCRVLWDFVELPSQIMENWLYEPETLALFARHFQTNQTIPTDLLNQLIKAKNFQSGLQGLRQI
ncbi:MAG: M3 family metallopeptidase, partial [Bdellovibrionaceae bacterium]|nr:M3 family metallopeptidase [Pseudobdellovibrionaceae bacterium]